MYINLQSMYLLNATHEKCIVCNMLKEISITIVAFFLIEIYSDKSHDCFIRKL